jgi:hypothetical protein
MCTRVCPVAVRVVAVSGCVKLAQACKVMGLQHSMTSRVIIAADAVHDV